MSKIVLITGCSTGIGFETAILMAQNGFKVYATMRNMDKAAPLLKRIEKEKLNIEIVQLDVNSLESVNYCFDEIYKKESKIDILINNAGYGLLKACENTTEKEVTDLFETNFMGTFRCVQKVLPKMRAAKSGHIFFISSIGGLVGQPLNEIYCASKFAIEGFAESLASYITSYFGIHITIVEPGPVVTEFVNTVLGNINQGGGFKEDVYTPVMNDYLGMHRKRQADSTVLMENQTGRDIAEVILECANSEEPPLRTRTSKSTEEFCKLKTGMDSNGRTLNKYIQNVLLGK